MDGFISQTSSTFVGNVMSGFAFCIPYTKCLFYVGSGFSTLHACIVHSNARHGGGTTIPHLNFSIPSAALAPVFEFSQGKAHEVLSLFIQN